MDNALTPVEKSHQVTKKDLENWLFGSNAKLTEQQKSLFYQIALAHNLNPAKREVYAIPYGNNFNVITGYEVYLKRAERTGLLEWWEAGIRKDGNEYVGFCTIKRKDRAKETTIEAWYNEYNQNNNMWKTKPRTMIRKVAIAQAFRMVFPDELGGLPYTADEMGSDVVEIRATPFEDDDFPDFKLVPSRISELIDSLNAAGKLGNAEKFLGKKCSEWTDAEVDKIEAAKKKKCKNGSPQSPTTAETDTSNGNASVSSKNTIQPITEAQMDRISELCESKGMPYTDLMAGMGFKNFPLPELDSVTAEQVIAELEKL